MELFVKPETIICKDGSIRIDVQAITPEYIDNHIKNIEAVGKLDIDEKDVANAVCFSRDTAEAKNKLVTKFNISDTSVDFLLEIGLGS